MALLQAGYERVIMDYESKVKKLRGMVLGIPEAERFLRRFAAEVLREAAKDGASGWNLPAVQKIFSEWLERRAAEIEGGK